MSLGTGEETVILREETREHTHIIGTTGEGKSKLLEYLIRHDIDNGKGVCFFDPSDRGDTLYNILRYCFSKRIKKVCLIDPFHHYKFNKVPVINPFHYQPFYKDASVANIMETVKTVFGSKDTADTPRINRYLPAILRTLWAAKATLRDSVYFTEKSFLIERNAFYEHLEDDRDMMMIEEAYRTRFTQEHLQSSINRLQPFFDSTLQLIYGDKGGIDFVKMVSEGWIILVNLYSGFGFEPIHTRLLGTSIINELIFALDRLTNRGWKGTYYLYIDEAGQYANRNLAHLLSQKRKTGLRVTLAHQYYSQFEDEIILDSVENNCKLKIAFYIPNRDDRDRFVRNAYGGELSDREVSYVLSGLKKQYAAVKKQKVSPHIIRIPDVPKIEISDEVLDQYINWIYQNEWYKSPKSIRENFKIPVNPKPPRNRAKPNRKTTSDSNQTKRKSIFDD